MKEDITVWLKCFDEFKGSRKFGKNVWLSNEQLNLYTDSSGNANLGCGVYLCDRWAYLPWSVEWHFCDIMLDITFLELVPILLAIFLLKNNLVNKQIKSKRVMQLIRSLVLKTMLFNLQGKSSHIEGRSNCVADAISRKQWARFGSLVPDADLFPTPISLAFQRLISGLKLGD